MQCRDFEERLRRFRAKQPPAGVRARLLSRAEQEVAGRHRRGLRAWRLRLAMAAALVVALAADVAADRITEARIAALTDGRSPVVARRDGDTIEAAMRQRARLLSMLCAEPEWRWEM
ncbi:hypothetical protein AMK68_05585 [candidate division KD3-62 bacterium DG_56]|uniref:Uncharacterized protein n=1 Tax=candidate division KD3-62 bacterium DG_56 TaxID=1704032 RepID=A0A0S7XIK9_9BACT|nr:MAG: hypothetical protein AMK68_05585 [candidate division KD3-62 bacterium DG_56]